jgi:hypothetical protein
MHYYVDMNIKGTYKIGQDSQCNVWHVIEGYKSAYLCLLYFRYFGYAIAIASENYQLFVDDNTSIMSYFQDYNTGPTKGLFVLVLVIQGFMSGYL